MQHISTINELRQQIQTWRREGQTIAFVPTMGNLHAGHCQLVTEALKIADRVVVSIFVNPLQFGVGEDYEAYPRTLAADQAQLQAIGTHLLFAPSVQEIYPDGFPIKTQVQVTGLNDILCGAFRPGHFDGVATVVNLLFNLVQPDKALFGQKDFQQLLVIKRMVADLCIPIEIIDISTIRENDGLAMSSRNQYLTIIERSIAPQLYQILQVVKQQLLQGERDYSQLEQQAMQQLMQTGFKPDYVAIRNPNNLTRPQVEDSQWVVLAAAYLGKARLIDNILVDSAT